MGFLVSIVQWAMETNNNELLEYDIIQLLHGVKMHSELFQSLMKSDDCLVGPRGCG